MRTGIPRWLIAALAAVISLALGDSIATAAPTTQLSRELSTLTRRVQRDEATIGNLRSQVATLRAQVTTVQGQIAQIHLPTFTVRTDSLNTGGILGSDGGQVLCQPGESIVGGRAGWGDTGAESPGDHLMYSNPITNPPGWIAGGVPDPGEFLPFQVFAIRAG
jgi:hypothetical protein